VLFTRRFLFSFRHDLLATLAPPGRRHQCTPLAVWRKYVCPQGVRALELLRRPEITYAAIAACICEGDAAMYEAKRARKAART
tara:strand:- start:12 stop:260 length:249 start_codon:yes stop_codon:yes gene_type:complete